MNATTFPDSLRTATPVEGHALARELAQRALAEQARDLRDIASHLAKPPAPSLEALTAAYFQAVASANDGWSR